MLKRIDIEQRELRELSPLAVASVHSKGRAQEEAPCAYRTCFQRDRDRIIHSKAFRRLMHKTQVFLSPEGDHYRTRLTHTLEVMQVARSIARGLNLNEDLVEAIAMGHDLGHTPFGHSGEEVLNEIHPGGFHHNIQSLRVVERLEFHNGKRGMNLTFEVKDGIRNHTGNLPTETLEGQVVKISDRIAYINHDIDDAIRSGVITNGDLPEGPIKLFGESHGVRINSMIENVLENSDGMPYVRMDEKHQEQLMVLRDYMFQNVYHNNQVKKEEELRSVSVIIKELYGFYLEHPNNLPIEYQQLIPEDGLAEAVKDHIAGMTDRFALNAYQKLILGNEPE